MLIVYVLAAAIHLLALSNCQQPKNDTFTQPQLLKTALQQKINDATIFGVRWMLGDHFSYKQPSNNQFYILLFNCFQHLSGEVKLYLESSGISCSYRLLTLQNRTEYIYRCNVNFPPPENEISYRIVNEMKVFSQTQNNTTTRYESTTLYSSKFRTIGQQIQPLFLGNLDIADQNEVALLATQLNTNKSINLLLFTGSFLPQLTLNNHKSVLLALQNITSLVPIVLLNVNSPAAQQDFIFAELFYTPQSQVYQSNFWFIDLPGNVMIMAINQIMADQTTKNQSQEQIKQILLSQLQSMIRQIGTKQPFFILMTPNFGCSSSVSLNNKAQNICARILKDISINLCLSSEAQGYIRTQMGVDSSVNKNKGQYTFGNPVRINQGNQFTSTTVFNNSYDFYLPSKGFGILQLDGKNNQSCNFVTYQHIGFKSGQIEDKFSLNRTMNQDSPMEVIVNKFRRVTIGIQLTFLCGVVAFITYAFFKLKFRRRPQGDGNVQMVEQLQNNPQNQLRAPII